MYQELSETLQKAGATEANPVPAVAWPGCYPLYYVTDDSCALCPACVASEMETIAESWEGDGWHVVGVGVHWESPDGDLFCDHCNVVIEPAYS